MAELLGGLPVAGQIGLLGTLFLTPWALLVFFARRFFSGEIVHRQQVDDLTADRDYWRTAHDTQQQIALKQGMTLERLLALAEGSNVVMTQIQAGLYREGPQ